ncbi:Pentatricopeptide repeat-containing protein [Drosera capensis]
MITPVDIGRTDGHSRQQGLPQLSYLHDNIRTAKNSKSSRMSISVFGCPCRPWPAQIHEHKLMLLHSPPLPLKSPPSKPSSSNDKTRRLLSSKLAALLTHAQAEPPGSRVISEKGEEKLGFEDGKLQVERFVARIREIPRNERWGFVGLVEIEVGLKRNKSNVNALLFAFVIVDELEFALKLFDKMPVYGVVPDSWTYSILIRCCSQKGEPDEAMRVAGLMLKRGFMTSVVTLNALVGSFCKKGRMKTAFEVVDMMGKFGCEPNVQTHNLLLKGLCYVGRVEEARAMLEKMKKAKEKPNIYSYTVIMDGLCKVGRSDEAMELLDEVNRRGLTPTAVTYSTLFNGYDKEGRPRKGLALMKRMKQRGCAPDYISYMTLLQGLLNGGEVTPALKVYSEMDKQGLRVDKRTMNSLLKEVCREAYIDEKMFAESCLIVEKMKTYGYVIFPDMYCRFIHTLCFWEQFDAALDALTLMVRTGKLPSMVTIDRVIRALCQDGRAREALSVFALIRETRKTPSERSYRRLIDGLGEQGDVLVAFSVYATALKQGEVCATQEVLLETALFGLAEGALPVLKYSYLGSEKVPLAYRQHLSNQGNR